MADNSTILRVNDLNISFKTSNGTVHAVRGVDFTLRRGEIVAIVGESGCGKSVTVKSIMGIQSSNESIDKGQTLFTYGHCEALKKEDAEHHQGQAYCYGIPGPHDQPGPHYVH